MSSEVLHVAGPYQVSLLLVPEAGSQCLCLPLSTIFGIKQSKSNEVCFPFVVDFAGKPLVHSRAATSAKVPHAVLMRHPPCPLAARRLPWL